MDSRTREWLRQLQADGRCFVHTFWTSTCPACVADMYTAGAMWGRVAFQQYPQAGRMVLLRPEEVEPRWAASSS